MIEFRLRRFAVFLYEIPLKLSELAVKRQWFDLSPLELTIITFVFLLVLIIRGWINIKEYRIKIPKICLFFYIISSFGNTFFSFDQKFFDTVTLKRRRTCREPMTHKSLCSLVSFQRFFQGSKYVEIAWTKSGLQCNSGNFVQFRTCLIRCVWPGVVFSGKFRIVCIALFEFEQS